MSKDKTESKGLLKQMFSKKTKGKKENILFLRQNMTAEEMQIIPEENGTYIIEGWVYHHQNSTIYNFGKKKKKASGRIFIEKTMYPMGCQVYLDKLAEKPAQVQYDMIKSIQNAETIRSMEDRRGGLKMNPKMVVLLLLGLIVVGYLMFAS